MARKDKQQKTTGFTILIVDDDQSYLEATRLMLEREGHEVIVASSGTQVCDLLEQQDVDLILLDFYMPGMTGAEVIAEVRPFNPDVQIVLQTGYASEQPARQLLRKLDIQGYYDKSEGPEKLLLWVDVGLKAARALQLVKKSQQRLTQRSDQLKMVNEELENLSYTTSRGLRTPLTEISGYAQILVTNYSKGLDNKGQGLLQTIRTNSQMMAKMLDDILALNRVSRVEMHYTLIDMDGLVRSLYTDLIRERTRKPVAFKTRTLPPAWGDRSLINQLLLILLSNALKFSSHSDHPAIEIDGQTSDREITYSIRDNGIGFDMQYANRLFSFFQSLHDNDQYTGTSAGLVLAQRIVQRHNGWISGEGKVGEGAVFTFAFPPKPTTLTSSDAL